MTTPKPYHPSFCFRGLIPILFAAFALAARAADTTWPLVSEVEWQPLRAQISRLLEASDMLGSPFSAEDRNALAAAEKKSEADAVEAVQKILDAHCLVAVQINPESRVKVARGPAKPELVEQGWRQFLVKVVNEAGVTAELRVVSPNAQSVFSSGWAATPSDKVYKKRGAPQQKPADLWLEIESFDRQPLQKNLSGLKLEYRIVQLYSRDAGRREAKLAFDVGQGTQDLGFRNEIDLLFAAAPAQEVRFHVRDENDQPATGMFLIRDQQGRIYPSQAKRLAPDFAFHPQVYRADDETERLPAGAYQIESGRGPEYLTKKITLTVGKKPAEVNVKLERWIDPSKLGWWSGDHHIHAAGCAHYTKPSEGVLAKDMIRQCLGEDLKVGANLTWGPCFDFQKQFFTGAIDKVSRYPYLLRYDVEVSGFGSHQSGHLCLLRLKQEIYPGGDSDLHWPTLCLNTLRWAKAQGAVCGPAHSGWGLEVTTTNLPNYVVPPFSGIGANEYIVDVTHQVRGPGGKLTPAVDFMSTVDTPYVWELNMWYQTLNVGFRTRISGETDFPCIYGERVGLGRSYVHLDGPLNYDDWCEGIRRGRNYVSDGKSHLIGFTVNDLAMGDNGSELKLEKPGTIHAKVRVAARLNETPNVELRRRPYSQKPYWDIERARVGDSRQVPVELIVNGYPVANKLVEADGEIRELEFDAPIERSSWVAIRILPSSHTNPIFVVVDDKPIRASRRSAEWCLKGVNQCWSQKQRFIKADEMEQAKNDYQHARETYEKLIQECAAD